MSVPVTVVTGFLGAGKTTLLNAWLSSHPRGDVAVIVNEIGAIGVDAELLAERARTIVEITGGCVCCVTHGQLVAAVRAVAARRPRRIFVETSGAASPAGVVRALRDHDEAHLDGVVTVVDASRRPTDDLALEQIGYADLVVLSRADLEGSLEEARAFVSSINGAAVVTASARGVTEQPLDALLSRRNDELAPATAHAGSAAIETLSFAHDGELDDDAFAAFMEEDVGRFAGRLLRIKGILAMAAVAERVIVQGVADRVEVTLGAPWHDARRTSRLVLVGFGLEERALRAAFAACCRSEG